MTVIRYLLRLLGNLLSLVVDGIFLIASLWFLIGLIGFGLLVVIALVYGLLSLF